MIYIYGPRDRPPKGAEVINTTSRSPDDWSLEFSPFYLGPCELYDGHISKTMENAWQFSKVYAKHADKAGNPTNDYWRWAKSGWADAMAHRYPMGKGAVPLYSLWAGEHLDYVEARKRIYIPLYSKCVTETAAWKRLLSMYRNEDDIHLWDFDGYDYHQLGMTLEDVVNCPTKKCGHAFVLAMLLEGVVNYEGLRT